MDEWTAKHPNMPPYERFLQDYISSHWPILWHMKRKFILDLSIPVERKLLNLKIVLFVRIVLIMAVKPFVVDIHFTQSIVGFNVRLRVLCVDVN